MPVSDQHREYTDNLARWELVKDCAKGASAVKKGKTKYLPKPNPEDDSTENAARYTAYVERANFVNFTSHTKKGMVGMAFRQPIEVELPQSIAYIEENSNGGGLTLEQAVKDSLGNVLEAGRYGLLVDYPESEEGATQAQTQGLQANILAYPATSILNWRCTVVDGIKKASLVVLAEDREIIATDGFSVDYKTFYRVLKLDEGVYYQEIYDEEGALIDIKQPRNFTGGAWDEIPFVFLGSLNNDETVDEAPLYDLAEVNLAHYRNSADYEESSFMVGQPTPVLSGLTQGWVDDVLKGKVIMGSRSAIPLPEGGSADLLQANPNQMPLEGMKTKEEQMIAIGARIIQDNSGIETAEAAKIRFAGQNSELASILGNIESAYLQCFEWLTNFMGGEGEAVFNMNRQFYDATLDAQQVIALIQLADRGDISQIDVRTRLRKAGWLESDKTDEEIDEEAEITDLSLDVG